MYGPPLPGTGRVGDAEDSYVNDAMDGPAFPVGLAVEKVGVMLDDLRDAQTEPRSLFPTRDPVKSTRLMAVVDVVNARFGRSALGPLSTRIARLRGTRHGRVPPRHTTRLEELFEAEAW